MVHGRTIYLLWCKEHSICTNCNSFRSYPVEIHASSLSGDVEASNSQVKMFESIVDGNFNALIQP